jgi:hypothetical protein
MEVTNRDGRVATYEVRRSTYRAVRQVRGPRRGPSRERRAVPVLPPSASRNRGEGEGDRRERRTGIIYGPGGA